MKLVLLICISLLVSLLHAAAMPVDDLDRLPMPHNVEDTNNHSHDHHASINHGSDQDEAEDFCPNNHNACCLIVTLAPEEATPISVIFREAFYLTHSLNQPITRLESLYRPPKFYLVSAA